jgi:starvation-inducible DNA-binding protein
MNKSRPCVEALKQGLSDSFTMYFMAHAYHWNVEGPDFHEYHDFFSQISDDIYGSVDAWAENIRKLGAMAPQSLAEVGMPSRIEEEYVSSDPIEMSMALYRANEVVIEAITTAFAIANEINEQGIADFLASRDDMHKKWRWQLNSITGMGNKPEDEEENHHDGVAYDVNGPAEYEEDMIFFGDRAEAALAERLERYNKKAPAPLQASALSLHAVYRRGARSVKAGVDRHEAGLERVDAFLRVMKSGRASYLDDIDLLPTPHQLSDGSVPALTASAELSKSVQEDADKPEYLVLSAAEVSGLGYEAEPIFRAAWMRAVKDNDDPFSRVMDLATQKYESKDADLLPAR